MAYRVNKLQEYRPEYLRFGEASYLRDDKGVDWYDSQKNFAKDTLKVAYDPDSKIVMGAGFNLGNPEVPDSFWPAGLSVAETYYYPSDFVLENGKWVFDEEANAVKLKVDTLEEVTAKVEKEIKQKIQDTMLLINPLQFAKDLEEITEDEAARLKALQKYVILLNRVPQQETYPTGVVWPEIPTT